MIRLPRSRHIRKSKNNLVIQKTSRNLEESKMVVKSGCKKCFQCKITRTTNVTGLQTSFLSSSRLIWLLSKLIPAPTKAKLPQWRVKKRKPLIIKLLGSLPRWVLFLGVPFIKMNNFQGNYREGNWLIALLSICWGSHGTIRSKSIISRRLSARVQSDMTFYWAKARTV